MRKLDVCLHENREVGSAHSYKWVEVKCAGREGVPCTPPLETGVMPVRDGSHGQTLNRGKVQPDFWV